MSERLPSILHLDGGRNWAGGQNQVRLLMRELAGRGVRQLCLCPVGSPLEARLREENLPVQGVPWRGGMDPRAMIAIGKVVREFDVVHCHDAHALQVAIFPARLGRVPVVASRRVHFPTSARKWNLADRVVAISETVRESLVRSGVDTDRIRLISSGVDPVELSALPLLDPPLRSRLGLAPDVFLAGNIGHLHAYKGQEVIPRAATHLPSVQWTIVGEGPLRAALESSIQERGVSDRVRLTGFIPDARRVLREFDLFVFSSVDEPLGTSVLDAMVLGVPIVGADAAGAREILAPVHEATGTSLYPPGDAEALAGLVGRLMAEPGLRAAMIAAQSVRLNDFLVSRTAELTLETYRELVRP